MLDLAIDHSFGDFFILHLVPFTLSYFKITTIVVMVAVVAKATSIVLDVSVATDVGLVFVELRILDKEFCVDGSLFQEVVLFDFFYRNGSFPHGSAFELLSVFDEVF